MFLKTPFDAISQDYDNNFTRSVIGRAQRQIVWRILRNEIGKRKGLHILDIGCGTGEDAIMLGGLGHQVNAIDISAGMIQIAKEKNNNRNISFQITTFSGLDPVTQKYDLIFSNFGALNCMDKPELEKLNIAAANLLKPKGKLIFILFGKYCWSEQAYFFLKGNKPGAYRRLGCASAKLSENTSQKTFFYASGEIQHIFRSFNITQKRPVGLFIPPSYMESHMKNHGWILAILKGAENIFGRISFLADKGDHLCLVMAPKSNSQ